MNIKTLLTSVLSKHSKLRKDFHDLLLSPPSLKLYEQAFVSGSVDPVHNYELFEQLGDLTINKFVVGYSYRKFPHLQHSKGVKTVARIRINYASKFVLADIADSLGFWPYIKASEEEKLIYRDDLLEDSFEAFIGVTEHIIDTNVLTNVGYSVAYDLLESIFDNTITISLKYEDLYDAKTRLKELFDKVGRDVGKIKYKTVKDEHIYNAQAFLVTHQGRWECLGTGSSRREVEAEKEAAEKMLTVLKSRGITKSATPRTLDQRPVQYPVQYPKRRM